MNFAEIFFVLAQLLAILSIIEGIHSHFFSLFLHLIPSNFSCCFCLLKKIILKSSARKAGFFCFFPPSSWSSISLLFAWYFYYLPSIQLHFIFQPFLLHSQFKKTEKKMGCCATIETGSKLASTEDPRSNSDVAMVAAPPLRSGGAITTTSSTAVHLRPRNSTESAATAGSSHAVHGGGGGGTLMVSSSSSFSHSGQTSQQDPVGVNTHVVVANPLLTPRNRVLPPAAHTSLRLLQQQPPAITTAPAADEDGAEEDDAHGCAPHDTDHAKEVVPLPEVASPNRRGSTVAFHPPPLQQVQSMEVCTEPPNSDPAAGGRPRRTSSEATARWRQRTTTANGSSMEVPEMGIEAATPTLAMGPQCTYNTKESGTFVGPSTGEVGNSPSSLPPPLPPRSSGPLASSFRSTVTPTAATNNNSTTAATLTEGGLPTASTSPSSSSPTRRRNSASISPSRPPLGTRSPARQGHPHQKSHSSSNSSDSAPEGTFQPAADNNNNYYSFIGHNATTLTAPPYSAQPTGGGGNHSPGASTLGATHQHLSFQIFESMAVSMSQNPNPQHQQHNSAQPRGGVSLSAAGVSLPPSSSTSGPGQSTVTSLNTTSSSANTAGGASTAGSSLYAPRSSTTYSSNGSGRFTHGAGGSSSNLGRHLGTTSMSFSVGSSHPSAAPPSVASTKMGGSGIGVPNSAFAELQPVRSNNSDKISVLDEGGGGDMSPPLPAAEEPSYDTPLAVTSIEGGMRAIRRSSSSLKQQHGGGGGAGVGVGGEPGSPPTVPSFHR